MIPHRLTEIPDAIIDEVNFEIPEAPHDSVVWALKKSIVEFCELSHYWQEDIGPVRVLNGIAEYDIASCANTVIVSVLHIKTQSTDGRLITLERACADDVRYRFWQYTPFTVSVSPVDDLVGLELSLIAALKPKNLTADFEFSESVLTDYQEAIIAGAKAKLYEVPRKPWFDPALHQKNRHDFTTAASDALRAQARGYTRVPDKSVKQKARRFY